MAGEVFAGVVAVAEHLVGIRLGRGEQDSYGKQLRDMGPECIKTRKALRAQEDVDTEVPALAG